LVYQIPKRLGPRCRGIYFEFHFTGTYDHLPEVAFYMVGGIEEVAIKADRLAEERGG